MMSDVPTGIRVAVDGKICRVRALVSMLVCVQLFYDDDTNDIETFDDVEKMFGRHIVDWLDEHHPKMLTVEIAVRWGLADSDGRCVGSMDEKRGSITCVIDATEPEKFWEAPFFTISTYQSSNRVHSSDTFCRFRVQTHTDNTISIETTLESRAAYLESVDDWCVKHPDRVYDLSASGARSPSNRSQESGLLTVHPVYCKTQGDCVVASIINMMNTEEGPTVARALLDMPSSCTMHKLGSINTWLEQSLSSLRRRHHLNHTYSLCKPHVDEPPWMFDLSYFVSSATTGKYIVRLSGFDNSLDEVDHTVFVDADRQLVFDCMETYAMRLSYEALECCIGDGIFIGAKEVREVRKTKLNSRNRKPRRKKRKIDEV